MPDWINIEATALAQFEDGLRLCQQSPVYHAEGDAYVHTMMVCDALKQLPEYQALNERQQHILYVAALLHDIGKIPTTVFVDGDWHTPHHAPTGSRMVRELLWKDYGLCGQKELMQVREAISLLIRYHSYPPVAIERNNPRLRLHRMAANSTNFIVDCVGVFVIFAAHLAIAAFGPGGIARALGPGTIRFFVHSAV